LLIRVAVVSCMAVGSRDTPCAGTVVLQRRSQETSNRDSGATFRNVRMSRANPGRTTVCVPNRYLVFLHAGLRALAEVARLPRRVRVVRASFSAPPLPRLPLQQTAHGQRVVSSIAVSTASGLLGALLQRGHQVVDQLVHRPAEVPEVEEKRGFSFTHLGLQLGIIVFICAGRLLGYLLALQAVRKSLFACVCVCRNNGYIIIGKLQLQMS